MKKLILTLVLLTLAFPVLADYSSGTTTRIHYKIATTGVAFPSEATSNSADCRDADYVLMEASAAAAWLLNLGFWSQGGYATQATVNVATGHHIFTVLPSYGATNVFVQAHNLEGMGSVTVWLTPIDYLSEQEYRHNTWYDANQ